MRSKILTVAFLLLAASPASAQDIALTFDDLPSHDALPAGETRIGIAAKILSALNNAGATEVYGFINAVRLTDDPPSAPVLSMWRSAGLPLGNHTYSHMNLNQHTAAEWEADTLNNEAALAPLMKDGDYHWLRYPFLAEGDTVQKHDEVRQFLAAHGYRIASVTMSFDDYLWNGPYARCVAKNDVATIAAMEVAYLAAAEASLNYYHALSEQLYGRDIPYVLLMHLGAFDARMMPRLLAMYRAKGVRFVSLPQAEADPFYAAAVNPALPDTPMTLEQAMTARGVTFAQRVVKVMPFETLCR